MITIEELRNRLAERLSETKESQNSMARRLGIQQSTLSNFLAEKKGLGLEAALVILEDMGYCLVFKADADQPNEARQEQFSQNEIDRLTEKCRNLEETNAALKENISLLKQLRELEQPLEKNEAPQEEGREGRTAPVANIRVDHSA